MSHPAPPLPESARGLLRIPTLQIADIELPEGMERLRDLAYDLWWSWSPLATRLFTWIDPDHWRRYHNPVELLINVEPHHWSRLLSDPEFRRAYEGVVQALDAYHARPRWFDAQGAPLAGPVAYFSMEFGLHESLGVYSGGLGVLAGDHCKAASDLGVPLVGVGLLYRSGYFRQSVDADGFQQHVYPDNDFARLPVLPVQAPGGGVLTVPIDLPGRVVQAAVWKAQVGLVPVLMLDTDIPLNDPADRPIASILYVRGREMRLTQEVVLGVGGVRALRALGVSPAVWHMNEGHVAFLGLERARERVTTGEGLEDALKAVARNAVFTTHTPIPAGNEIYDRELVRRYLGPWSQEVGADPEAALALGTQAGNFNLTVLAIRLSSSVNGVSQLHGQVSSAMWRHLWPGGGESPVSSITNGVHTETWVGPEMRALYVQHLDPAWEERLLEPELWGRVADIPDAELWAAHRSQKERLVRFVRERVRIQSARHGLAPDELRGVERLLDPRALTIGFARRFATYKRAVLVLSDLDRLRAVLSDADRPVQLIFAGKAHPADRAGQDLIRRLFLLTQGEFRGKLVFLEDYDMEVARMMVQGCDVWLNTPRRPQEASGTSGQKSPINGGVNLSILDGWWVEGHRSDNGWAFGAESDADVETQDKEDAVALYRLLEEEVVPLFFAKDADGLRHAWIARMKASIASIVPRFSAHRMVGDYVQKVYVPAASRRG
ncbi:MAG: alpha-glucan phosphorylase [Acidobacteria bacterium]|nr:MAG: alpha-glucan phosphorylase [Acidobacteriota bacterium]PYQ25866.1 MAG: alpha-glucan phosphorylase [Acidobacteriota bacterium]